MLPSAVTKDGVKWAIMPPQIILKGIGFWPETQTRLTTVLNTVHFASFALVVLGLIISIKGNAQDLGSVISGSVVMLIISIISVRKAVLVFKRPKILKLLHTIYFEFWPSSVAEKQLQRKLAQGTWFVTLYCGVYISCGFVCGLLYFVIPLLSAKRALPLPTSYPFAWKQSPYYEMLYVWQSLICCAMPFSIIGFDWLFAILLWNCIAQFKILAHKIQTGLRESCHRYKDTEILIKCINHHQKLIEACKDIQDIYTFFLLVVVLGNVVAMCFSIFILVVLPKEFGKMITYCAAHFCQMLLYCFLGEQLISESTALADAAFASSWHLSSEFKRLKTMLVMIIARSQNEMHLTVGGFAVLNLASFLKVLKMVFSLYTLLNSLLKRV